MDDNTVLKLAAELGAALKKKGWNLALAESCTGGMAAQTITAIPGSSAWFERGFVTYSNLSKIELLGVNPETLEQYGAVSEQAAREMALGALSHSNADIAAAITGIAGPDGGTAEKPVGTVCFACATKHQTTTFTLHFVGDRSGIRQQSVQHILQSLQAVLTT